MTKTWISDDGLYDMIHKQDVGVADLYLDAISDNVAEDYEEHVRSINKLFDELDISITITNCRASYTGETYDWEYISY